MKKGRTPRPWAKLEADKRRKRSPPPQFLLARTCQTSWELFLRRFGDWWGGFPSACRVWARCDLGSEGQALPWPQTAAPGGPFQAALGAGGSFLLLLLSPSRALPKRLLARAEPTLLVQGFLCLLAASAGLSRGPWGRTGKGARKLPGRAPRGEAGQGLVVPGAGCEGGGGFGHRQGEGGEGRMAHSFPVV